MSAEGGQDKVVYIDEYQRRRWHNHIQQMREIGGVAVFNADLGQDAKIIPFPRQEDSPEPEGAA